MKKIINLLVSIILIMFFIGLVLFCGYIGSVKLPSELTQSAQSAETIDAQVTAEIKLVNIELTKMALVPEAALIPTPSINSQNWHEHFINEPTCQIPCWENITPNKTDIDTATRIVAKIPGVQIIYLEPTSTSWSFDNKSSKSGVITANEEGIVIQIHLGLNESETLNLGDVIKLYGDPHAILEGMDCNYIVSYRYQGMLLSIIEPTCSRIPANIKQETQIARIILFSPDNQDFTLDIFRYNMDEIIWDGYKTYDFTNK